MLGSKTRAPEALRKVRLSRYSDEQVVVESQGTSGFQTARWSHSSAIARSSLLSYGRLRWCKQDSRVSYRYLLGYRTQSNS